MGGRARTEEQVCIRSTNNTLALQAHYSYGHNMSLEADIFDFLLHEILIEGADEEFVLHQTPDACAFPAPKPKTQNPFTESVSPVPTRH